MNLMTVARLHGYDTCAIGGFDKNINDALCLVIFRFNYLGRQKVVISYGDKLLILD